MIKTRNLNVITENGNTYLEGIFTLLDKPNNQNLVYDSKSFSKIVETFRKELNNTPISGELYHPEYDDIRPENAAIWI